MGPGEQLIFHCPAPPLLEAAPVCGMQNHRRLVHVKEAGGSLISSCVRGMGTVPPRTLFRVQHSVPTWSLALRQHGTQLTLGAPSSSGVPISIFDVEPERSRDLGDRTQDPHPRTISWMVTAQWPLLGPQETPSKVIGVGIACYCSVTATPLGQGEGPPRFREAWGAPTQQLRLSMACNSFLDWIAWIVF